jgi:hypothetical protein
VVNAASGCPLGQQARIHDWNDARRLDETGARDAFTVTGAGSALDVRHQVLALTKPYPAVPASLKRHRDLLPDSATHG